jgi:hypothetical protein
MTMSPEHADLHRMMDRLDPRHTVRLGRLLGESGTGPNYAVAQCIAL